MKPDGYYAIRIVPGDPTGEIPQYIEIHDHNDTRPDSLDFLGVDPSDTDIAQVAAGIRQEASDVAFVQSAFGLLRATVTYHDGLVAGAEAWLREESDRSLADPEYAMNPDEEEVLLQIGKQSLASSVQAEVI